MYKTGSMCYILMTQYAARSLIWELPSSDRVETETPLGAGKARIVEKVAMIFESI